MGSWSETSTSSRPANASRHMDTSHAGSSDLPTKRRNPVTAADSAWWPAVPRGTIRGAASSPRTVARLSVGKSYSHAKSIPYMALVRTLRPKVKQLALTSLSGKINLPEQSGELVDSEPERILESHSPMDKRRHPSTAVHAIARQKNKFDSKL